MQDLTHYYQNIFTLKSGKQIEIWTRQSYNSIRNDSLVGSVVVVNGFIKNPLLVEKTVEIDRGEIASLEIVKDPCIVQVISWPEDVDVLGILKCDHPKDMTCAVCSSKKQPLAEHKPTCAGHNNPPAGFSSEVTQCDCGVIVSCVDDKILSKI